MQLNYKDLASLLDALPSRPLCMRHFGLRVPICLSAKVTILFSPLISLVPNFRTIAAWPESIQRWLAVPAYDEPWSPLRTTIDATTLAMCVESFLSNVEHASEIFSRVASSGVSSQYVISIPDKHRTDIALEECHNTLSGSLEFKQVVENWKSGMLDNDISVDCR